MILPTSGAEPVVVRGGAADWPAARWSLSELARRVGDRPLPVHTGRWRPFLGFVRRDGVTVPRRGGAYLESLAAGDAEGYLAGNQILRAVPALREDLRFPDVGPLWVDIVWIGPRGLCTPAHYDRVPNVYAQLLGQKRWTLWRPERRLGGRLGPTGFSMSRTDLVAPDLLPSADDELTLGPGDVLYLPAGWWHRVHTVSDSVAANRWWLGRRLPRG